VVVVVSVGAALVGGIGAVPVVVEDDPLLHAASTRAPTKKDECRTPAGYDAEASRPDRYFDRTRRSTGRDGAPV
jgi:hypothetical protein